MSGNETFADIIKARYEVLNNNESFKEKFSEESFKILLNPKDGSYAALIIVDKGTLSVESIENKPKENIKKGNLNWDGLLQTKRETFRDIGDGKLERKEIVKKVVTGKIKVKGADYLVKFGELSLLLRDG